MVRFLKQLPSSQKGQALAIVLCLLAIGGLTIAVSLNYATTSLKGSRIIEEKMEGVYAAGAGVEHALWSLKKGYEPATQLSENIGGMAVRIETLDKGTFTWYLGQLVHAQPPQVNIEWLDVVGEITDLGGGVYRYDITVTWQPGAPQSLNLEEVGARLPVGFEYQDLSANIGGNLSTDEPDETQDIHDAWIVNWASLGTPSPQVSEDEPVETQTFYITGTGSTSGHYACVKGQPNSVGPVGEIKGTRYRITATATRPEDGRTTAEIVADVIMHDDGTINIVSWQISN